VTAIGTVSIDRTSLSADPLVIDTEGFSVYLVDVAGLGRVGTTPRETFATPSPWVHGQLRTAVVKEESTLPLTVRVQAGNTADLHDAVHTLEAALFQFVYTVTVTLDGQAMAWTAYPATIGAVDGLTAFERVTGHFEDLSISIPVYPVAVSS
jgi:hypothetical protein